MISDDAYTKTLTPEVTLCVNIKFSFTSPPARRELLIACPIMSYISSWEIREQKTIFQKAQP